MSIVVGFINTAEGQAALAAGISEAGLRSSKLVVLHSMVGGSHEGVDEYIASAEAIEKVHNQLKESGIDHCTHEYVRGNKPVDDLMDVVKSHDAELIIIGIRSRSATGKLLLGSNALDILRDTKVPVLCVKPT